MNTSEFFEFASPSTGRLAFNVLLPTLMALYGLKKKSLSVSGSVAAWLVGFVIAVSGVRNAIILITFFLSASKMTKLKQEAKRKIEDDFKEGGQRDFVQVLSNGGIALTIALVQIQHKFTSDSALSCPIAVSNAVGSSDTLPTLDASSSLQSSIFSTLLQIAFVASLACCNGDTWASELGTVFTLTMSKKTQCKARLPDDEKVAKKRRDDPAEWSLQEVAVDCMQVSPVPLPRFILPPFRLVPIGTNGGVSWMGTLAATLGGGLLGVVHFALYFLMPYFESAHSNTAAVVTEGEEVYTQMGIIFIAAGAGFVGSTIDSVLGALLQYSGYSLKKKKVVSKHDKDVVHISGMNVLDNHQVNFLSSLLTAVIFYSVFNFIFDIFITTSL